MILANIKNSLILALFTGALLSSCAAQKPTLSERLGYSKQDKLLIIHADDLGVAHSENAASIAAFEKGMVNSGSIMVPCAWFPEIAAYSRQNPTADLGLHLTLTAEWEHYKWGPVSPLAEVPSLVNEQGFMYDNCQDVVLNASVEEVEKEVRAQIERAIAFGVNISHLDSHMGCLFNPKFFGMFAKVARSYNLPFLLTISGLQQIPGAANQLLPSDILIEETVMLYPAEAQKGVADFYEKAIRNLPVGVSSILIHTAYDDAEMQAVTIDHPDYGAAWRQEDFDFFTSERCRRVLEEEGVKLITWRALGQLLKKN